MKYHNYKSYNSIPIMEQDYIIKFSGVSHIEKLSLDEINEIMDSLYLYFSLGGKETAHFFTEW
jgi:hypothetical protein